MHYTTLQYMYCICGCNSLCNTAPCNTRIAPQTRNSRFCSRGPVQYTALQCMNCISDVQFMVSCLQASAIHHSAIHELHPGDAIRELQGHVGSRGSHMALQFTNCIPGMQFRYCRMVLQFMYCRVVLQFMYCRASHMALQFTNCISEMQFMYCRVVYCTGKRNPFDCQGRQHVRWRPPTNRMAMVA